MPAKTNKECLVPAGILIGIGIEEDTAIIIRNLTVDILASGDDFVIPQSNPPHI